LLDEAVARFGSEEKLGLAIGYTQHGVHRARRAGSVPPRMAYAIHVATKGLIDYRALCPLLDCETQLVAARAQIKAARGRLEVARAQRLEAARVDRRRARRQRNGRRR